MGANGGNLRGSDFDLPWQEPPTTEILPAPPYWWVHRARAARAYSKRLAEGTTAAHPGSKALAPATAYLLALELGESASRRASALRDLRRMVELGHITAEVRGVVSRVLSGELCPDRVWIGPLEWALLEASGVRWPGYAIVLADLGERRTDELEREVGRLLETALQDCLPEVHGGTLSAEGVLRWYYWTVGVEFPARRAFLLEAARQATKVSGRTATQRLSAMLAVLGLAILGYGGDWDASQREALRAVSEAGHADAARIAFRLLRYPADACGREVRDDVWRCIGAPGDGLGAQAAAGAAPSVTSPPQLEGPSPGFEHFTRGRESYTFPRPQQRLAIEVLWSAEGQPVHEVTVFRRIDHAKAEDPSRCRLRDVFRQKGGAMHPAWQTLIVSAGLRTRLYSIPRSSTI